MTKGLAMCDKCDYFISVEDAYKQGRADATKELPTQLYYDGWNDGYKQGRADGIRSTFDAIKSMLKMGIPIERIELLMADELKENK